MEDGGLGRLGPMPALLLLVLWDPLQDKYPYLLRKGRREGVGPSPTLLLKEILLLKKTLLDRDIVRGREILS